MSGYHLKYVNFCFIKLGNCGIPNHDLIKKIHELGMKIFPWTFKNELSSLCWDYLGDVQNELEQFFQLGVDGFFADYPNTVSSFLDRQDCLPPNSSDSDNDPKVQQLLVH